MREKLRLGEKMKNMQSIEVQGSWAEMEGREWDCISGFSMMLSKSGSRFNICKTNGVSHRKSNTMLHKMVLDCKHL